MKKRVFAFFALVFFSFTFCNVQGYAVCHKRANTVLSENPETPILIIGNVTGTIVACEGNPSNFPNVAKVTISGDHLSSDVYISPPAGFEVSLNPGNTGYTNSLTITAVTKAGEMQVPKTILYIRASIDALAGAIPGNIIVSTTGIADKTIAVSSTVYPAPVAGIVNSQSVNSGQVTAPINFTGNAASYKWTNDSPVIGLAASGTGNIAPFNAINNSNNSITANLTVVPVSASGCDGKAVLFNITIEPELQAGINAGTAIGTIVSCEHSASQPPAIQQFTVAGKALSADIIITAPPDFEISQNQNGAYSGTLKLKQMGGLVGTTNIFVRASVIAATGTLTENIKLASKGFTTKIVPVKAIIKSLPSISADNTAQTVQNGSLTLPINFSGPGGTFTWFNNTHGIGLASRGIGNIEAFNAINRGNTDVIATITATPEAPSYAYIANQADGTVSVINLITYKTITTIGVKSRPTGVSVSADGTRVYVSNTGSDNVSVISTAGNAVIATIPVGKSPQGIAVGADGSSVYVANSGDNTVSVINTLTNAVSTITVGATPFGVAVSPDGKRVYVSNTGDFTMSIINTATNTVINVPAGSGPQSIAVSPDGSRVYIDNTSFGKITVINTTNGAIVATIPTSDFSANPGGLVVSPDGTRVYAAGYIFGILSVIDAVNNTVMSTIRFPSGIGGVSLNADGSRLYVAQSNNNTYLGIVNTATNTIIGFANVGMVPVSIGNFVTRPGCSGTPVNVTVTVKPSPPGIQVSRATGTIFACKGTPSYGVDLVQFRVSGNGLTGNINITAPANFDISLNAAYGFGKTLSLAQSGTLVPVTVIYVRSSVTAQAGIINDNVMLSSQGVPSVMEAVSGIVNELAVANAAPLTQNVVNGSMTKAVSFTGSGNTISWVNDSPGIGLPATGTGNIAPFKAINTGTTPIVANFTVTSSGSGYVYAGNSLFADPLTVINTTTNKVVGTINTGSPLMVAVSPDNTRAYVGNRTSGSISVIDVKTNKLITNIGINGEPYYLAISPDGGTLYVSTTINTIAVINTSNFGVTANIPTGLTPNGLVVSPNGKKLYVTLTGKNVVSVITTDDNKTVHDIVIDQAPNNVLVSPDGSRLYITYGAANTVAVVNTITYTQIAIFTVNLVPFYAALSPDGSLLYLSTAQDIQKYSTSTYALLADIAGVPTGMSFSPDGSKLYTMDSFNNEVIVYNTANDAVAATIPVNKAYTYGNFIARQTACDGPPVKFTIEVEPSTPAVITAEGELNDLSTVYGTASVSDKFSVSATGLQAEINVKPPPGFEVSLDNLNFSSSVTLGATGAASTPVYIRLAALAPVKKYNGNIVLTSPGADDNTLEIINGEVIPAPLTISADDKTKFYEDNNPPLTVSYEGFVNNDNATLLTTPPVIETTATLTSIVGKYPITVSGAAAANYTITYAAGVLTITPKLLPVVIPNTFTPNGDTFNDDWVIQNIEQYPLCTVNVFDRYGQKIFTSNGYTKPWDGKYNGKNIASGVYYYIINLENGSNLLSGYVQVIR